MATQQRTLYLFTQILGFLYRHLSIKDRTCHKTLFDMKPLVGLPSLSLEAKDVVVDVGRACFGGGRDVDSGR